MMTPRWLTVAMVALSWCAADACSCQLKDMHPQTQFCYSDFVIVGRVQKLFKGNMHTYKVKIRNIFKATEKAEVALKSGRIFTAAYDSMCGITMQPRETYIIAGYVTHLQAHVNICNYVKKWREVTPRQRKGFRLLYKQGCTCKVKTVNTVSTRRQVSRNTCVAGFDDCYEKHGICLHDHNSHCRWTRVPRLVRCLQEQASNVTKT